MTATTSKLGADMTDEQIAHFGHTYSEEHDEPLFTFDRAGFIACVRALLARQPAAIDKDADDDIEEAREILENMVRSIELDGNYSTEATCTFLRQALNCLPVAAPLANEASQSAAIENESGECVSCVDEKCVTGKNCVTLGRDSYQCGYCKDTGYLPDGNHCQWCALPAAPSVEQDERGACLCTRCNCWVRPSDDCSVCNRAASTSAKVEAQDKMAIDELGMHDAARKLVQSLGYVWTDGEWCYGSGARAASTSANVAQGAEAVAHKCALCGSSGACESSDARLNYECGGAWYRPSAANASQPAQKVLTDDARDAKRYRRLRQCNSGSLVIVQIIGTGEDDQIVLTEEHADEAIDAALSQHKAGEKDE